MTNLLLDMNSLIGKIYTFTLLHLPDIKSYLQYFYVTTVFLCLA